MMDDGFMIGGYGQEGGLSAVTFHYSDMCDMKRKCGIAAERNEDALMHVDMHICA